MFLALSIVLLPIGLLILLVAYLAGFDLPTFDAAQVLALGDALAGTVLSFILLAALGVAAMLVGYSLAVSLATAVVEAVSSSLSWLTGHPQLQSGSKLASWSIFVVGFGLDFLAS